MGESVVVEVELQSVDPFQQVFSSQFNVFNQHFDGISIWTNSNRLIFTSKIFSLHTKSGCKVFSWYFQVNQVGQVTEEQEPDSGEEETQV